MNIFSELIILMQKVFKSGLQSKVSKSKRPRNRQSVPIKWQNYRHN